MKKIISLFQRNYDGDRLVRDEVVPGAEWVAAGEGIATRKYDGTCCLIRYGKLYKRFEVKRGGKTPVGFEPATETDDVTGKTQGWLAVGDWPEDQWHREGLLSAMAVSDGPLIDGTYELCGPKIQGNPEQFEFHKLVRHGCWEIKSFPRTFEEIQSRFRTFEFEGIVWHHPDGRLVKIKKKDFYR